MTATKTTSPPNVIVTGELITLFTVAGAGNAAPEFGSLDVALCGYGSFTPEIQGAKISLMTQSIAMQPPNDPSAGNFEILLYSNDLITPPGTYYTFTVRNANGDIVQCEAYILSNGQYDLTQLTPIDPDQPPPILPTPAPAPEILYVPADWNMVFDGSTYTAFTTTLPGNVNAPTIQNMVPGNLYTFVIIQDGSGGHIFTWPAGCHGATAPNLQPNGMVTQTFIAFDATNLYAIAPGAYS